MDKMQRRGLWVAAYFALALILIGAAIRASADRASACSCLPPRPPLEALSRADKVFIGEVVAMETRDGWWASSTDPITVEFKARAGWKGEIHETMFIKTAWSSASCGFEFVLGEQYIVYAREDRTSLCSRTKNIEKAGEDIMALGEGATTAPNPNSNSIEPLFTPIYGALALAIIGLLGARLWFALRRRSG